MPKLSRLRNEDYSDRELLFVIDSVSDADGLSLASDVAEQLGIESDGKRTPAGTVSGRMSWMKRYGFVDRIDPKTLGLKASEAPRWIITPIGRSLMQGRLAAPVQRELDKLTPGTGLLLMRGLTQRAYVEAPIEVANALRREYTHNIKKR